MKVMVRKSLKVRWGSTGMDHLMIYNFFPQYGQFFQSGCICPPHFSHLRITVGTGVLRFLIIQSMPSTIRVREPRENSHPNRFPKGMKPNTFIKPQPRLYKPCLLKGTILGLRKSLSGLIFGFISKLRICQPGSTREIRRYPKKFERTKNAAPARVIRMSNPKVIPMIHFHTFFMVKLLFHS